MTNTFELTDTYHLFEEEGDLYFVLTLKNNTSKTIEVSATIKPFNIYRQNYESVEERYILSSSEPPSEMIKIAPNDSHDLEFMINDYYLLEEGENVYDFYYFYNKNDDELKRHGDYKRAIGDKTIFSFTWKKNPNSIKGKLISYKAKNN